MLSFFTKHKKTILVICIIAVAVFMVVAPVLAQDKGKKSTDTSEKKPEEPSWVQASALWIVGKIVEVYVSALGWIVLQLVYALIVVAKYNNFVTSDAVTQGWVIVRDVVNMFFILILLVIAFATIFNVKEYKYQAMLPRLLIMAVVINFSRTIAGLIIDFGQVVMLTFVNGFQAAAGGNFVEALHIKDLLTIDIAEAKNKGTNFTYVLVGLILAAIMITVTLVVIAVMLMILVMRIVVLWFLVVLSPAAFLASVWPSGKIKQKYAEWWDQFIDNVMVGPLMAFFLWLSLLVLGSGDMGSSMKSSAEETGTSQASSEQAPSVGITEAGTAENMISYLMGIGMLLGSLYMTQNMKTAGRGLAGAALGKMQSYAKGAVMAPGRLGWKGTKFVGKKAAGTVYEKTGARAFLSSAKIEVQNQSWAKKLGLGSKEYKEEEKLKRDEKMARAMGQTGRANKIENSLIESQRKKISEKGMTITDMRKHADQLITEGKQGTHEYKATVKELAANNGMQNNADFVKYAGEGKTPEEQLQVHRLEEQLRMLSLKAGNKLAMADFDQPDKRKAASDVLNAQTDAGQKQLLAGAKAAVTKTVDGEMRNGIMVDVLLSIDKGSFHKYGAVIQKEANDALLLAYENTDNSDLKSDIEKQHDELNGAAPGTFMAATAARRQTLVEEQSTKIGKKQVADYRIEALKKSDVDMATEGMIGRVGKDASLGGGFWQQSFLTNMYETLRRVAMIETDAEANNAKNDLNLLAGDIIQKARDVDGVTGNKSGQFDEKGNEMSHEEVVKKSTLYKNLEDASKLADSIAREAAATGKVDNKKKEAAAGYANVATRYVEDATEKGTKIPKGKVRVIRDKFDPLQGVKTYNTLVKEYSAATLGATKKLDGVSGITDPGKRTQELGTALNRLESAIKLMDRNEERFSPTFLNNLGMLRAAIDTIRGKGATAGKDDVEDLKKLLEMTKNIG